MASIMNCLSLTRRLRLPRLSRLPTYHMSIPLSTTIYYGALPPAVRFMIHGDLYLVGHKYNLIYLYVYTHMDTTVS